MIAAVTIISRNYLAFARVLANSFLEHHSDATFYVYLCDSSDGIDPQSEPFELLQGGDVHIPQPDYFFTQYSVMEANTAVKPYVLEHVLFKRGHDAVVYLDPDIQVFRSLKAVWSALEFQSAVLIPHMLEPLNDDRHPSELAILQSGTYNLGFLGLSPTDTSRRLLRWWQEKLYRNCVVDIPRGLFVDQKWMDLAPGYFSGVHILRDPTYNVAYWNLHERRVGFEDGVATVDGQPLTFFHFSGYSPFKPNVLSKHQNRHHLADLPAVKRLCDAYGARLLEKGHAETTAIPYAHATLPNGITVSPAVRQALRLLLQRQVAVPSPWRDPDGFARKLMTIDEAAVGRRMAPLQKAVLEMRPDVADAFPGVHTDPFDPGFVGWLDVSGRSEMGLDGLLRVCPRFVEGDLVREVFNGLDNADRTDVYDAYDEMWFSSATFEEFCGWIAVYGATEIGLDEAHLQAIRDGQSGPARILGLYLRLASLQERFRDLTDARQRGEFRKWLAEAAPQFQLSVAEISLFDIFCRRRPEYVRRLVALYGTEGRRRLGAPLNALSLLEQFDAERPDRERDALLAWLLDQQALTAFDQVNAYLHPGLVASGGAVAPAGQVLARLEEAREDQGQQIPEAWAKKLYVLLRRAEEQAVKAADLRVMNVAGFFSAPTGMGYSARSMLLTAEASGWQVRSLTLPSPFDQHLPGEDPAAYGWPSSLARCTVTVANADTTQFVRRYCPSSYWSECNIGYWVWETEDFPPGFATAARAYDAIWTPSRYSAEAIAAQVDVPVYVLPHVVDADALGKVGGRRADFGLPDGVVIFGFFFDPKSVLERKNPLGVVRAFRAAFGDRNDVLLVIKVNGAERAGFDYQLFKSEVRGLRNVILIEATYSRSRALELMNCLDVYVSLHRSEGFGLTCAEAMAMGKPVIATDYSGNRDFMDADCACMVPARVVRAERDYPPYTRGSRWGDPDIHAAAEHMKGLLKESARRKLGLRARRAIETRLSPRHVGEQMKALLEGMGIKRAGSEEKACSPGAVYVRC